MHGATYVFTGYSKACVQTPILTCMNPAYLYKFPIPHDNLDIYLVTNNIVFMANAMLIANISGICVWRNTHQEQSLLR